MKFDIKRDKSYLKKLQDCINKNYDLEINKISEASRGVDGETWILQSGRKRYFAKISYYDSHKVRFINSVKTLKILNDNNIKNINSIIRTTNGKDYMNFEGGLLTVYTFVNGEIDFQYPYNKIIRLLLPVYRVKGDFKNLIKEDFNINNLCLRIMKEIENSDNDEVSKIMNLNKNKIIGYLNGLKYYHKRINRKSELFITHGDACVNVMVAKNKKCLIDWDDSIVAPIERDCWFFIDSKDKIGYINNYFNQKKFNYKLSNDLLFFYAYKRAIEYIDELIIKYKASTNTDNLSEIEEILNGWVDMKLEAIKKVWGGFYDVNTI